MTSDARPGLAQRAMPRVHWGIVIVSWLGALLAAALLALAFVNAGDWDRGIPWDLAVLEHFRWQLPVWLDVIMLYAPLLGTNTGLFPIAVALAAWLYWRARRPDLAAQLIVVEVGAFALTFAGKIMFDRARPALWEPRGQYAHASYPSGHAIVSVSVLLTFAILLYRERGWRWPFVAIGALMLISLTSRLYLGVHWPTDVVAGIVMGVIWLVGTLAAFSPRVVDHRQGEH